MEFGVVVAGGVESMSRVPMGVIVDTPTGTFKNRFVDNVNQLEDAIAHFMPELPSNVFAPILAMTIVFAVDWHMGLAGIATIPLGVLFYLGMMRDYKPKNAVAQKLQPFIGRHFALSLQAPRRTQ